MSITHLTSVSQLNTILAKSNDKLTVIDFHAAWCGPCHAIAPHFEALSKKHTNVNFLKCDVDEAKDVASLYKVSAMPTFIFLKGDSKVDQVRGADKTGLTNTITKHASSPSSSAFSGKGQTLGSSSSPSSPSSDAGAASAGPLAAIKNMDIQMQVFIVLIGTYTFFWWLGWVH
ncbi:hypothetical protein PILCRDRAFT_822949 [Piloderma croceum F 1598]|uniref:Thioredoxin domain-containing protein n=1 Tax=Piloderma croceum (strain F 1598) TaxID=765440 RepID=A0A0C3F4Z3_PILCF|nr:hypothetical protein PILCRDRAFT_822949 [Piloderma croceum F 1598]